MADTVKEPTKKTEEDQVLDGADSIQKGNEPEAYEFADPDLKGKSSQEIEELFRMSKSIVQSQKTKLDKAGTTIDSLRAEPLRPKTPEGEKKGFFDDPDGALLRLEERMAAQIDPLRKELQQARGELKSQGVYDRLRERFKDWDSVYPWVKGLLAEQEYPNPDDEGLLSTLYYTAKGVMLEKGLISTKEPNMSNLDGGDPPTKSAPPQHRSSPPPPAPKKKEDGESEDAIFAEFDETEKAMCRIHKMKPSEFKAFRDEEADEVVTSQVGLQKKEA